MARHVWAESSNLLQSNRLTQETEGRDLLFRGKNLTPITGLLLNLAALVVVSTSYGWSQQEMSESGAKSEAEPKFNGVIKTDI